ncbi:CvpA family protein [Paenisporosarcina quisquiliarum]|uniref:CvpA family protein n=1 Tax=Paenisporosarcina quisquiliarum TaxID=365346 RepID=A0A9X3LGZ3_9BACL|nr:CvpA family protein [Paenisporosarcina quisquiliarum]MCZ8536229.1 CvpA family protein [Paenisporosarcina quisquiliarum]
MLDIIILVLLAAGIFVGAKRGLIVQLIHMTGFIIALIVAYSYYKPLAEKFVLWIPYPTVDSSSRLTFAIDKLDLDQTFYQLIAFALIFFVVKFALQLVASMFDFLSYLPVLGFISRIAGAFLGFIEFYILLFILIYVVALMPIGPFQNLIEHSNLAESMLKNTPFLSETVKNWWYIYTE